MVDQFTHHPVNGITLCLSCHTYVHGHSVEARDNGWIVSRYCADPSERPVKTWRGWMKLEADSYTWHSLAE